MPKRKSPSPPPDESLSIDHLLEEAQRTAIESIPENTRRAYATDWNQYRNWCQKRSRVPLPATADTVSAYLTALAKTHAIATLRRRLTMVAKVHRVSGKPDPTTDVRVKQLWRGILRTKGEAQRGKKPLLIGDLRRMTEALPKTLQGDRDRALLLLGFAGGLRRSELVALDVEDLEEVEEGIVVHLRRSKTDQTGKGARKGIPFGKSKATCPVRAVIEWLRAAEIFEGPVFRAMTKHDTPRRQRLSAQTVALVVKNSFRAIGKRTRDFSAHSLRSGLVSDAKARYFGGAMSLRWWYRQIELGRLPHYRAGGSVLLRPADVEAFVGEMFRDKTEPAVEAEIAAPLPVPATKPRSRSARPGLRFFAD